MRSGILIAGALLLCGATGASAAPFTNGSFEAGSVNPGAYLTLGSGSTAIDGWQVFGTVDYIGSWWQAADGSRSIDLNGWSTGGIEQTFDTVAGTQYRVRFALAGNPDGAPDVKQAQVESGTFLDTYSFDAASTTHDAMGWAYESFLFTAAGSSTTLRFSSQTPGDFYGAALDDVSVNAVPEPASVALLATGIGLFVARRRRR